MTLETMRGDCAAGDAARLFGAVEMEAGGASLCSQKAAECDIDQLTAAERRPAGMSVEGIDDILVEGDGDAASHQGIVRVRGPRSSSSLTAVTALAQSGPSGRSTSPSGA